MTIRRYAFAFSLLALLVVGCGRKNDSAQSVQQDSPEPLKDAFAAGELGPPLDWKSLSETDRAFASALQDGDAAKAKAALANGAKADLDCGHGCSALMLAAATGDQSLVAAIKKSGAKETPDAEPFMEILNFAGNAERPEFKTALAEIGNLTGKKPMPAEQTGAYAIELKADEARTFLEKHHSQLLKKGCYVFLHDQNFGIEGKPDILWILPTTNKFAVMAFTGVNGINYDIDNYLVIRWMKRLDRDQPFILTGCGLDFLSGRFVSRVADAKAMAKRMYMFCPDIVDQGTGSVDTLAGELRKTKELYFWWD